MAVDRSFSRAWLQVIKALAQWITLVSSSFQKSSSSSTNSTSTLRPESPYFNYPGSQHIRSTKTSKRNISVTLPGWNLSTFPLEVRSLLSSWRSTKAQVTLMSLSLAMVYIISPFLSHRKHDVLLPSPANKESLRYCTTIFKSILQRFLLVALQKWQHLRKHPRQDRSLELCENSLYEGSCACRSIRFEVQLPTRLPVPRTFSNHVENGPVSISFPALLIANNSVQWRQGRECLKIYRPATRSSFDQSSTHVPPRSDPTTDLISSLVFCRECGVHLVASVKVENNHHNNDSEDATSGKQMYVNKQCLQVQIRLKHSSTTQPVAAPQSMSRRNQLTPNVSNKSQSTRPDDAIFSVATMYSTDTKTTTTVAAGADCEEMDGLLALAESLCVRGDVLSGPNSRRQATVEWPTTNILASETVSTRSQVSMLDHDSQLDTLSTDSWNNLSEHPHATEGSTSVRSGGGGVTESWRLDPTTPAIDVHESSREQLRHYLRKHLKKTSTTTETKNSS